MIAVDLHNRFTPPWFPCGLTFEKLSSRLVPVQLGDTKIKTLSPVDTLLTLAIQIAKDAGGPYLELAKICDVAELLQRCPNLDLFEVHETCKSRRHCTIASIEPAAFEQFACYLPLP